MNTAEVLSEARPPRAAGLPVKSRTQTGIAWAPLIMLGFVIMGTMVIGAYGCSWRFHFAYQCLPCCYTAIPSWPRLLAGAIRPAAYWRFDCIIHRIHLRVLEHIRAGAEAASRW